jgi:hypothetical protein
MTGYRTPLAVAALMLAAAAPTQEPARAQVGAEASANAAVQVLVGTWQGDLRDLLGTIKVTLKLAQDGSYTAQHVLVGGYTILMRGRWTAQFTRPAPEMVDSRGVLSFEATESQPEEFCSAGIEINPLVIKDPDTIELGDGTTTYPSAVLRRIR